MTQNQDLTFATATNLIQDIRRTDVITIGRGKTEWAVISVTLVPEVKRSPDSPITPRETPAHQAIYISSGAQSRTLHTTDPDLVIHNPRRDARAKDLRTAWSGKAKAQDMTVYNLICEARKLERQAINAKSPGLRDRRNAKAKDLREEAAWHERNNTKSTTTRSRFPMAKAIRAVQDYATNRGDVLKITPTVVNALAFIRVSGQLPKGLEASAKMAATFTSLVTSGDVPNAHHLPLANGAHVRTGQFRVIPESLQDLIDSHPMVQAVTAIQAADWTWDHALQVGGFFTRDGVNVMVFFTGTNRSKVSAFEREVHGKWVRDWTLEEMTTDPDPTPDSTPCPCGCGRDKGDCSDNLEGYQDTPTRGQTPREVLQANVAQAVLDIQAAMSKVQAIRDMDSATPARKAQAQAIEDTLLTLQGVALVNLLHGTPPAPRQGQEFDPGAEAAMDHREE